ncbi:GntR family transcriptional regulator [Amycolatopsis pigmentata]|uniref:GntR family transcriptional regulator n=1 Tax=Amycolatopsis pigmentata TaxID=450801 RepID=A0ABW5G4D4_9PSEU
MTTLPLPTEVPDSSGSAAKESLSDKAIKEIRRWIIHHRLTSTTPFSEGGLAEALSISKAPVREALALLRRQGWVTVLPRSGYVAVPTTIEDARNLFTVRVALEGEAAALAARRASRWPEETDALLAYPRAGQDAVGGTERMTDHYRFHRRIALLGGNQELDRILSEVLLKLQRYQTLPMVEGSAQEADLDHGELAEAIQAGDADRARAVAVEHVTEGRDLLISLLLDSDLVTRTDLAAPLRDATGESRAS